MTLLVGVCGTSFVGVTVADLITDCANSVGGTRAPSIVVRGATACFTRFATVHGTLYHVKTGLTF